MQGGLINGKSVTCTTTQMQQSYAFSPCLNQISRKKQKDIGVTLPIKPSVCVEHEPYDLYSAYVTSPN